MDQPSGALDILKEWLEEEEFEPTFVDTNGIRMLRVMVPLLEDGRGLVLMEICTLDYSDDTSLIQIYSTMTPEAGPGIDGLRKAVNGWNLNTLAGAYGIYEKLGQLFHRHIVAVPADAEPVEEAEAALRGICMCMDEMVRRFPEALSLNDP